MSEDLTKPHRLTSIKGFDPFKSRIIMVDKGNIIKTAQY